jgi:pilus assembly protein Flp/PilA
MSNILQSIGQFTRGFLRDEEGAQIVEYALIIAVVSIALIVALQALTTTSFATFITRVSDCLTGGVCK